MLEFKVSAEIHATPERIWEILTDGPSFPEWDPYCIRIEGEIASGARIKAFTTLAPERAFPVKVSIFEPGKRMVWSGGMPLGLFKGERFFELEQRGESVHFTVREVFTGPMLLLIRNTLPDMNAPFQAFVQGLKERAEA